MSYPLEYDAAKDTIIDSNHGARMIKVKLPLSPDGWAYFLHAEAMTISEKLALAAWSKSRELGE